MKLTDPKLTLTFLGNDLEPGHETTQVLTYTDIVKDVKLKSTRLSGLKSSSDVVSLLIRRRCSTTEDIISTDGNIKAVLTDGETVVFTGYISTNFKWLVTDHGEEALSITIESVGTRLFSQAFIETGKHFFSGSVSSVVYNIVNPLGITIRPGDERKLLQEVSFTAEAGKTCRELLDQLFYECNAVYYFDNLGQLCVMPITADTESATEISSDDLVFYRNQAIYLTKSLRTYKGARVSYKQLGEASNYLVYRNTTGQDSSHPYCNLELQAGEYFDGAEIYTAAEWSAATADTFREPTLIGAVNADSEASIVGSGAIVNIDNLNPVVQHATNMTAVFDNVGGGYFKLLCHNNGATPRSFTRLDLYADIVYEKSTGVIRTTIDGTSEGKTILEEELSWIHDKENAQKHANLLAQYYKNSGATYTFYSRKNFALGGVIELHDDVYSGLDVFCLLTARDDVDDAELIKYTAVGITTFDLSADAYHGTTEQAHQSGAQGPAGEPGASSEVQYALGDSIVNPPTSEMQWGGVDMLWDGEVMTWNEGLYTDEVPELERGKYIWMRSRVGDGPWQYTRLTGTVSWDAESLGVAITACPTQSKEGLGLIPGDYFIAGATFTDGGIEYKKGFAYTYNGTGWDVMDLSLQENSAKALQLAGALFSSGINVTDSTASIWGWFQNLIAQQAVIDKLVAEIAEIKTLIVTGNIYNDALQTIDASTPTVLDFVTSSQNYYSGFTGEVIGTCQQLKLSDILDDIPVGTSYATSGSFDFNGTTYTASEGSPIKLFLSSSLKDFHISQNGSYIVKFQDYGTEIPFLPIDAEEGYLAIAASSGFNTSASFTNNSLGIAASLGKILVHDVEPMTPAVDKVGTTDRRFASGAFSALDISNGGLKYTHSYANNATLHIPASSTTTQSATVTLTDAKLCYCSVVNNNNDANASVWLPVNVASSVPYRLLMSVGLTFRAYDITIIQSQNYISITPVSGLSGQTDAYFTFYK